MKNFMSAATVVLGAGVALAGTAVPATAAPKPALLRVHATTPVETAGPVKTLTAKCPSGYRVISGDATTWDTASVGVLKNHVYLTRAQPYHSKVGDGYTVTARVRAYSGKWMLAADAICAKGLSGVGIATATKVSVMSGGTATAVCARGTRVLGFGGQITGNDEAQLDGLAEAYHGTAGYATGTKLNSRSRSRSYKLTAYAVCAKAPVGWKVINKTSAYGNWGDSTLEIICPAGTRLFGAGGAVLGGQGRIHFHFHGSVNLTSMSAQGYADPVDYDYSYTWASKATAVCAD
jgi:hypothetical protein